MFCALYFAIYDLMYVYDLILFMYFRFSFYSINIRFEMFFIKMFDQMRFTSKIRSENCLYKRRSFYNFIRFTIFLYWFWNAFHQNVRSEIVRIERFFYNFIRFTIFSYWFWDVFHQNVRSKIVSREWRFFLLKFFVVNANVIISKIINFRFTIAHEIYDNERINSTKMSMILSSCLFYFKFVNMFLLQSFLDQIEKFVHYQYYYLLAMNESIRRNVNDFIVVCTRFWICLMHYSILLFFSYRRSRLMHNRKQKRNHFEKLIFRC